MKATKATKVQVIERKEKETDAAYEGRLRRVRDRLVGRIARRAARYPPQP